MANWVIQYDLDGIDVVGLARNVISLQFDLTELCQDYEDFNAINAQNGSAESWLETFTKTLR
jgi:hypothetical protein